MGRKATPPEVRVWRFVDAYGDCWDWTGGKGTGGYGHFKVSRYKCVIAHRYVWELLVGPIPAGLELDHLCRRRHCVNPDHLEPVTKQVNNQRRPPGVGHRKESCIHGHPMSGDNLIVAASGRRYCRTCRGEVRHRRVQRYRLIICPRCGREQPMGARNLCAACYKWARTHGRLDDYPPIDREQRRAREEIRDA
jgi:hypothetical protein